jgi:hypothetical protein
MLLNGVNTQNIVQANDTQVNWHQPYHKKYFQKPCFDGTNKM